MAVLDFFKKLFSGVGSYKNSVIILVLIVIFLIVAIYTYRTFISPKVNPKYVANSEYVDSKEGNNKQADAADLYFFYTTWCPHCKKAMPVWNSLKDEVGTKEIKGVNINFVEVDCDKDTALAEKFNVQGYPTIKLVRGNQVVEYDAKPNKDTLMEFLNTSL
jgi:thiol-disulfide isomerase/thioredoxin